MIRIRPPRFVRRLTARVGVALCLLYAAPLLSDSRSPQPNPPGGTHLRQWHPEADTRCITLNNRRSDSTAAQQFTAIFRYLGQEKVLLGKLLETAAKAGVAFCLDDRADGTRGYYDYTYNVIAVREGLTSLQKTAIVLHELRHVAHVLQGYRQTLEYAMNEMVRMTFAVEADVQAFSALFAWRLKRKGEPDLWDTLLQFSKYADIDRAFEAEINRSGDELLATNAAFVQWYASPWRTTNYYRGCCMGYLDMLDETKAIERYRLLPDGFFDRLCVLPDGRKYGCQYTGVIEDNP